jgi:predicted ATPase
VINNKVIDKIRLRNFKCYSDQEFKFAQLTVFCGANSVGKSSAIQALLVLMQSKFRSKARFNGSLISLGQYTKDILKHDCLNDVSLELSIRGDTYKWNYDDESDALLLDGNAEKVPHEKVLDSFQYIQAERLGPEDNYKNREEIYHSSWLGKKGEFTSEVITDLGGDKIKYRRLEKDDFRLHGDTKSVRIDEQIRAWMQEISPNIKVLTKTQQDANISFNIYSPKDSSIEVKAKNVGFGMSYALGVVSALLITPPGSLVVIENPEAHLHPRAQSYMGRLIARASLAGVQVILETHSDHLLNGIRVISSLEDKYADGDFCVYFIDRDDQDNTQAKRLDIGEYGELPDWPAGFFDQQIKDMKIIISGRE